MNLKQRVVDVRSPEWWVRGVAVAGLAEVPSIEGWVLGMTPEWYATQCVARLKALP